MNKVMLKDELEWSKQPISMTEQALLVIKSGHYTIVSLQMPEVIVDEILSLKSRLAESQKSLAEAYETYRIVREGWRPRTISNQVGGNPSIELIERVDAKITEVLKARAGR